jgi:hypothetical protein
VILVGGGSIVVGQEIAGVGEILRPKYLEVANAVGAAVSDAISQSTLTLTSTDRQDQWRSRQDRRTGHQNDRSRN